MADPIYVGSAIPADWTRAALNHLSPIFDQLILKDQDSFGSEEGHEVLLELIPDVRIVKSLRESWSKNPSRSSTDKWMDLKREIVQYGEKSEKRVSFPVQHVFRTDSQCL